MMEDTQTVELDSLLGEHIFSGADFDVLPADPASYQYETATVLRFRLDGVVYRAQEDPSDGYRSSLGSLTIDTSDRPVPAVPATRVIGEKRATGKYGSQNDVVDFVAMENSQIVLSVGTDNVDDYYPGFVGDYNPKALPCNKEQG